LKKHLQPALQILFFALFVLLIINGKMQLWMGLFALSVLVTFLLGRVYCGWICPINTAMRCLTWIKKKLHIKSAKIPTWITRPWVRIFVLLVFIAVFIFTMVSGRKLPVLPALIAIGAVLTLFFPEELWHRYLCPYGTIMSVPARKSKHAMRIQPEKCNRCGMCVRACPAKAVEKREGRYQIIKEDCIVCMECSGKCKPEAIHYR
jgi:ferredoxin-type protein NapH